MGSPHRTALPLAFALAALAGGCGQGDPLSAEELTARGDELCAEGRERFDEIQRQPPGNASEAADQAEELVEVASEELDELEDLRPPEELSDPYDRYLEARRSALESLERGRDAASDSDAEAYASAQREVVREAEERERLARAVGFEVCGKPTR